MRLAESVRRIEYCITGSDFESWLALYRASLEAFGDRARKRLKLRPPVFLRMAMENAYPRVYVTNRITKGAANHLFGPFPSRNSAEAALEAMLNLFLLRRCVEELNPDPAFPGCVYSEMKKCLAPCFKGCTDERYSEESLAVRAFLATRGESLTKQLEAERDAASADLDFERAAEVHARVSKAEAAASLMPAAVHPLAQLRALVMQPAAGISQDGVDTEEVHLFLLDRGCLAGPVAYSVAGMRHQNEQSGSSSLFAHPMAMQAVPLDEGGTTAVRLASRDVLEERLETALAELRGQLAENHGGVQQTADQLCLFSRWYFRPQARRVGEACFADENGDLPKRSVLRAISRVYRAGVSPNADPA
ncbi:UvrB/UvrC motif-containing protein [Silvibacterium sp.]|uniref:UvrB/UvrC motif-containing protein n=1 Tax=Silvibacterium sp. TaxID=1964179 RepID=UPI0039E5249E